jgi:hypothetical protein
VTTLHIVLSITPGTAAGMHVLLLTYAMPAIVMVVMVSSTPEAECAVIQSMVIHTSIIAMSKVYSIVSTAIGMIACGYAEIEVIAIVVAVPYTHSPRMPYHIYRTVEVVTINKSTVLTTTEYIHKIFVTHVEQVVIVVYSIIISIYYIIDHFINLIQEIKVDFIHIIVLTVC